MLNIKTNNVEFFTLAQANDRKEELLTAERTRQAIIEIKDSNGYIVSWNLANQIVVLWQ